MDLRTDHLNNYNLAMTLYFIGRVVEVNAREKGLISE